MVGDDSKTLSNKEVFKVLQKRLQATLNRKLSVVVVCHLKFEKKYARACSDESNNC